MAENINLSVSAIGSESKKRKMKQPNLEKIAAWIRTKDLDEEVVKLLLYDLANCPYPAWEHWVHNFSQNLTKARLKLKEIKDGRDKEKRNDIHHIEANSIEGMSSGENKESDQN